MNENINVKHKKAKRTNEMKHRKKILIRKNFFTAVIIAVVSIMVLLGNSIHAYASSHKVPELHEYYTSVKVKQGDTLWKLTDSYVSDSGMTKKQFIRKICKINGISKDDVLHKGDYIVVCYYSTKEK